MIRCSDDFYTFIASNQHRSLICHVLYLYQSDLPTVSSRNYLDVDETAQSISYLPLNRHTSHLDNYRAPGRVSGKPARILRSVLPVALNSIFTDADFEQFADLAKAWATRNLGEFRIVTGNDIPYWYNDDNYASDRSTGSLASSCMRHDYCQEYLQMYADLAPHLSMLIYTTAEDYLLGRALLWHADDGRTYMDRAYGLSSTIIKFHDYARKQGWWKRTHDTYSMPQAFTNPDNVQQSVTISIPLPKLPDNGYFPFMDTMKFINLRTHTLTNSSRSTHVILESTDGSYTPREFWDSPRRNIVTMREFWDQHGQQLPLTPSEATNDQPLRPAAPPTDAVHPVTLATTGIDAPTFALRPARPRR